MYPQNRQSFGGSEEFQLSKQKSPDKKSKFYKGNAEAS